MSYNKEYLKDYYHNHKEELQKYRKRWYQNHRELTLNRSKKYYKKHKNEVAKRKKDYRKKSKIRLQIKSKKYYQQNKEIIKIRTKKYYENNKEKAILRNLKYIKRRRKEDINFRLKCCLRKRVWEALKNSRKSDKTMKLLGCSIEFLKQHLEKKFKKGMNWNNYGKWHVDHIHPCASFNLSKIREQRKCFHYTNLQPLWAEENILKGSSIC